jgi:dipeptidyl aminopeptidase/acylaminoacyl peptidase
LRVITVRDELFKSDSGIVETIAVTPADAAAEFAVVYVHGYGFDAVSSLPAAWYIADESGLCLLVSQPGFGRSDGPPDYCGPKTVAAVIHAAERLLSQGIASAPLGIWGFSRGAIVAGQVIRRRPDIFGAAVLQAGGYDLERDYAESRDEGFRTNVMRETRGDPGALRERSLLHHVDELQRPVLVLQGDSDGTYMPHNAARLVAELARQGKAHEYRLLPGEHELPWALVAAEAVPFLKRELTQAAASGGELLGHPVAHQDA